MKYGILLKKWYDEYFKRDDNASIDDIMAYTNILAKTGSVLKGEKILKTFLEKYPKDGRLWSRYGYFNYWLGKYKIAEDAFKTSLEIKPGLKEAEDGLDLTRNQGYKAFYQPRSFERILPIDNYYDILKEKPGDDATRFLLVDALLKANRLEEAQQQIIYLQPNYQEDSRFKRLLARLTGIKNDTYSNKIEEYKAILKENPDDTEIVRVLAEYYTGAAQYTEAEDLLKSYLEHNPNDIAMRFFYAQVLSFDKKLEEAYSEIQRVMEKDKEPINHKLLAGQLGVWLEKRYFRD